MIRQVRPERILGPSPERNWERIGASHPDHLAVGEATIRAVYPAARNPFAFPELLEYEGLEPWTVSEVWLMGHPAPAEFVDVTDTFDRKIAALHAHRSQTEHMGEELRERVQGWLTHGGTAGRAAGGQAGRELPGRHHRLRPAEPRALTAVAGRRPTGSARAGWTVGACAAPRIRGSPPSSPR